MAKWHKTVTQFVYAAILTGIMLLNGQALAAEPETITLTHNERAIPVWHWKPQGQPRGVILFSHGAASAPWKYEPLVSAWVNNGYHVYGALHVDSTDHPQHDQYTGLASWTTRLQDMQVLADTFGQQGYVAAGHSYGGLTALVKGGATGLIPEGVETPLHDSRVQLVLAFSPPGAIPGFIEMQGYSTLATPALIQTGTQDVPMGTDASWQVHLDAFNAAQPDGQRYALVLEGVDHYFGGLICRPELPGPKQTAQMTDTINVSLQMLAAYTTNQPAAKGRLNELLGQHGAATLSTK